MKRIATAIVMVLFAVMFDNCSTDMKVCTKEVAASELAAVNQTQLATDVALIDAYLAQNNITAVKDGSMRYVISVPGVGAAPCLESKVAVTYTGRLLSNTSVIFDQTSNDVNGVPVPVTFTLSGLILGWRLGFLKLSKGASVTLYVPSGYAYGASQIGKIPRNGNLIFELTLVDFAN